MVTIVRSIHPEQWYSTEALVTILNQIYEEDCQGCSGDVGFTGFTHMCGKTRKTSRFIVRRKTIRKRLYAKLKELKEGLRRRWHEPVAEVGKWLKSVVQGCFNYHAAGRWQACLRTF